MTARGDNAVGLSDKIFHLFIFAGELRTKGLSLSLDGNYRKKRAPFDFLARVPELLEACLKKYYSRQLFVEADTIDADAGTGLVPKNLLEHASAMYLSVDSNMYWNQETYEGSLQGSVPAFDQYSVRWQIVDRCQYESNWHPFRH